MNHKLVTLFLMLSFFATIQCMDKKDDFDWGIELVQAIKNRDAQGTALCLFKGADPLIATSCGEHTYLIDLLDEYFNSPIGKEMFSEWHLLGMTLGLLRQSTFDNYVLANTKAVMYVLMKAGARSALCKLGNSCTHGAYFKRDYRGWFYEKMEQLEKKIDYLKDQCYYGRVEAIEDAVAQKVPLFVPDAYGNTILHTAFAQNHSLVIKKILEHDQSLLMLKNNGGKFPSDMASRR